MMDVFSGYFDEILKSFMLDFISLVSVSYTKSSSNWKNERDHDGLWNWYYKNRICMFWRSQHDELWEKWCSWKDAIEMMHFSQYMSTVDVTGYYVLNH